MKLINNRSLFYWSITLLVAFEIMKILILSRYSMIEGINWLYRLKIISGIVTFSLILWGGYLMIREGDKKLLILFYLIIFIIHGIFVLKL